MNKFQVDELKGHKCIIVNNFFNIDDFLSRCEKPITPHTEVMLLKESTKNVDRDDPIVFVRLCEDDKFGKLRKNARVKVHMSVLEPVPLNLQDGHIYLNDLHETVSVHRRISYTGEPTDEFIDQNGFIYQPNGKNKYGEIDLLYEVK